MFKEVINSVASEYWVEDSMYKLGDFVGVGLNREFIEEHLWISPDIESKTELCSSTVNIFFKLIV